MSDKTQRSGLESAKAFAQESALIGHRVVIEIASADGKSWRISGRPAGTGSDGLPIAEVAVQGLGKAEVTRTTSDGKVPRQRTAGDEATQASDIAADAGSAKVKGKKRPKKG